MSQQYPSSTAVVPALAGAPPYTAGDPYFDDPDSSSKLTVDDLFSPAPPLVDSRFRLDSVLLPEDAGLYRRQIYGGAPNFGYYAPVTSTPSAAAVGVGGPGQLMYDLQLQASPLAAGGCGGGGGYSCGGNGVLGGQSAAGYGFAEYSNGTLSGSNAAALQWATAYQN